MSAFLTKRLVAVLGSVAVLIKMCVAGAVVGAVVCIVHYRLSNRQSRQKRESIESMALIEDVRKCSEESFDDFKLCVRPMFASNYDFALKVWRRERRMFLLKLELVRKEHDGASEELKHAVDDFVLAVRHLDLSRQKYGCVGSVNQDMVNHHREALVAGLRKMDKQYAEFSAASEGYDCFVPCVKYEDEYR